MEKPSYLREQEMDRNGVWRGEEEEEGRGRDGTGEDEGSSKDEKKPGNRRASCSQTDPVK